MNDVRLDLPDQGKILALADDAAIGAAVREAMVRTWADVEGTRAGRRRWVAAWRAWLDGLQILAPDRLPPAMYHLVDAALDIVEQTLCQ